MSGPSLATKAGVSEAAPQRPLPPFTAEHEKFRQAVRRFVATELYPHAQEWEDARWFPNELFQRVAELGYFGLKFPAQYGGDGDIVADAVWVEELAGCGSGGVAAGLGAHSGIALPPIWKFGTDDQKQRYLVPGIRGEKIFALAITEPDTGSDVASIRTQAKRVDGGFVLNGSKMFITNGVRADVLVTAVKTTGEGGHHGISFLLVERGPGVDSSAIEKLGWHASDTALITFDDVFVPEENLLGEENGGFYLIMANFQWERLLMALGASAGMRFMFEKTLKYALEQPDDPGAGRQGEPGWLAAGWPGAFSRAIGRHQAIRHKLAEIAVTVEASRDVTYAALRKYVAGEDAVREVTIAKLATQRAAFEVADECLQIHGDAGYLVEYEVERAARDARLGPIGGGTDEIMKEILGRSLGL
jgi:acyl-CoA dehydrogenase